MVSIIKRSKNCQKVKAIMNGNEWLNKLKEYRDQSCYICGRKYPETILNIEGYIHHTRKFRWIWRFLYFAKYLSRIQ